MPDKSYDLIVIGAGPGGYPAAIRAAQLGLKTACIEAEHWGGICLNWGCIPTKSLLKNAETWHLVSERAQDYGIEVQSARFDFSKVIGRSRKVAENMNKGIQFLFKKYKVDAIKGRAKLISKDSVEIFDQDGKSSQKLRAQHIILATGARPRAFPGMEIDRDRVITSKEAMVLPEVPESITIVGSGAIGSEFAYFFNAFGVEVTIIEALDRIVPLEDHDISAELQKQFKRQGIKILTGAKVLSAKKDGKGAKVVYQQKGKEHTLKSSYCLIAVGVQGNIENLGLESVGVKTAPGKIVVDGFGCTNIKGIYAVGDVAGPPWLAHKATHEALVCVEKIAGKEPAPFEVTNIPGCTYCQPQVASVGLTEQALKEQKRPYKVGKFPFKASGKAQGIGETQGFVKVLVSEPYGEILGAHIIGSEATELIAEYTFARELEADAESIVKTIHAHPTLSETLMEAAALAEKECIHL